MKHKISRAVSNRAALAHALKTIDQFFRQKHGPAFEGMCSPPSQGFEDRLGSDQLLSPAEVAKAIGLSEKTLANWRCSGTAPLPFVRSGSRIRYRTSDVLAFLNANHRSSTSDNGGHDDHR